MSMLEDFKIPDQPFEFDDAPRARGRRFSPVRALIALGLIGAIAYGSYLVVDDAIAAAELEFPETYAWNAPYVDVTVTPSVAFEDPGDHVNDVVLSFVVADATAPCTPAWGAVYDLDAAGDELDMDRRITRLRQTGRDVVVSFGGAINDELAVACDDARELAAAYGSVVERYDVSTIDLDIEGTALTDYGAHARRATAVAAVQAERVADDEPLAVWLTLPVTEAGLTEDGVAVVDATLAGGVELAGVNIMTMNFGTETASGSLVAATESAVEAVTQQVLGAWGRAGLEITPTEAWARIGVTPMLGRNDVVDEVFTLDDAAAIAALVDERGLARLSYWSLNRDRACGPNEAPLAGPSSQCSHVEQEDGEFAAAFAWINGRAATAAGGDLSWAQIELLEDDPERSPYDIWSPEDAYLAAEKVVWHGYVYEAKWWTLGDNPEAAVANAWETPWRIVGPVLEEDLVDPISVPAGLVDAWDGEVVYLEGERVWLDGSVYEAKWWTQGYQPNRPAESDALDPWEEIDPEEYVESE